MSLDNFKAHFFQTEKIEVRELKDLSTMLTEAKVRKSKADVRRTIKQGGVSINLSDNLKEDRPITKEDLLFEEFLIVKVGKKQFSLF